MVRLVKIILRNIGKLLYYIVLPFHNVYLFFCWFLLQVKMGFVSSFFFRSGENMVMNFPNRIIGYKYISIGDNFVSLYGLRIEAFDNFMGDSFSPMVEIGDNVCFNTDCHIACINKVKIGNNVLIASRVFITDHSHGSSDLYTTLRPSNRALISKGAVIIGNNVWIGEGVVILPDVMIGDNCIIGANSVVSRSFPENSVIAGVPAKLIKILN